MAATKKGVGYYNEQAQRGFYYKQKQAFKYSSELRLLSDRSSTSKGGFQQSSGR